MAGEREGKLPLAAFEPKITLKITVWGQWRVNFSTLPKESQEKMLSGRLFELSGQLPRGVYVLCGAL